MGTSILIVRDEGSVADLWRSQLKRRGYDIQWSDWESSLAHAERQNPQLIVVDVAQPLPASLVHCQRLHHYGDAPVLLLADQSPEGSMEPGIHLLLRPVRFGSLMESIEEALADIHAPEEEGAQMLQVGEILLDVRQHVLIKGEHRYPLPPKQFQLLHTFMTNPGQVLSRKQLIRQIWDTEYIGDTRTLYVHVRWLRLKIEDNPNAPVYLRTVRGVGYRFNGPE